MDLGVRHGGDDGLRGAANAESDCKKQPLRQGRAHNDGADCEEARRRNVITEMVERKNSAKKHELETLLEDRPKLPWIHRKSATAVFASAIILNALMIGVEVDTHKDDGFSPNDVDDLVWLSIELSFIAVFVTELMLRINADGIKCMRDPWNAFDAFLISVGIAENILMTAMSFDMNFTFMRLLRLVRLARIVRMLRFFKALFLLLLGMYNALRMIIWMLILLWSLIYLCSIVARQTIGDDPRSKRYFGSMRKAMITFFQLSTIEDWPEIYDETVSENPWFGVIIIAFIFFTNMLLLNLITGVIVENTLEITRTDEEEQLQQLDDMKVHCLKEFDALLRASDLNGNGLLDREELEQLLEITAKSKPKKNAMFFNRAIQTLTEERTCAILKWFPAKDLLTLFDLCEAKNLTMHNESGIEVGSFLDIVGRAIGVRGGIARAQDQILGQYEVISMINQLKSKLLEACDHASQRIDKHSKKEIEALLNSVKRYMKRTNGSIEKLAAELGAELEVALQELFEAATEALPQDTDQSPRMLNPHRPKSEATVLSAEAQADHLCVPLSPEDTEALGSLDGMIDGLVTSLMKLVQCFRSEVDFSADLIREQGLSSVGVLDGLDVLLPNNHTKQRAVPPSRVVYPTAMPVLHSSLIKPLPTMPS